MESDSTHEGRTFVNGTYERLDGYKSLFLTFCLLAFNNLNFFPSRRHIIENVVLQAEQPLLDNYTASKSSLESLDARSTMKEISILQALYSLIYSCKVAQMN